MKTRLTKSEMEIMEVLWDEGKALTTSEIIQRSKEKEKEWKDSSVHLLIKSLMNKDVIKVEGFKKKQQNSKSYCCFTILYIVDTIPYN